MSKPRPNATHRIPAAVAWGLALALLSPTPAMTTAAAGPLAWLFPHAHAHAQAQEQGPQWTLAGVGGLIDAADREIRAAGTIVIKQPDVWGQDRMTSFRRDFDLRMRSDLERFQPALSGQALRLDAAALTGQGTIGASFTPIVPTPPPGGTAAVAVTAPAGVIAERDGVIGTAGKLLETMAAGPPAPVAAPALPPPKFVVAPDGGLNLEPTVVLDEKKRFLDHGYELLRVNLGDDTADAAGYGLYLFRLPVSIDPGGPTCKGWGALLTVTVRHEFSCAFLPETFRNLVINDLVDLLAPIIVELTRSDDWRPRLAELEAAALRYKASNFAADAKAEFCSCVQQLKLPIAPTRLWKGYYPIASADLTNVLLVESFYRIAAEVQDRLHTSSPRGSEVRSLLRQELEVAYELMRGNEQRNGPLADIGLIESIAQQVEGRRYEGGPAAASAPRGDPNGELNLLAPSYRLLMSRLPGNLEQRALGSLCWAIAVEAGLLNRQIRVDMWRLGGTKAFACPANLPSLFFYSPIVAPEADQAFRTYVETRWPLVAFALDPVTDQQNVADAYQRSRDQQLALAGAFAAGRLGAGSLARLMRQTRYDAEALLLNRTVTAFAHGADTFGWRFYPRYQNPRDEPSHLKALGDVLIGGFDPSKSARLEPGQRELTAAIIVPSFLRNLRIETVSNWFKLSDPAIQRVDTATMLAQGQRVVTLRQGLACACDADRYRTDDVRRLATRIDQLEQMLPLQTHILGLPYDNTLGGFELFTQGAMSLVPELVGYEGIEGIDPCRVTDLLLIGKHLSLSGTRVIVSGVSVPEDMIDFISRRAVRVRIPAGVVPTASMPMGPTATPAYEVYAVTQGGTSNRLVIPWVAPAALPVPSASGPLAATPPPPPLLSAPSPHARPVPSEKIDPALLPPALPEARPRHP
jgi:hypothetical protein